MLLLSFYLTCDLDISFLRPTAADLETSRGPENNPLGLLEAAGVLGAVRGVLGAGRTNPWSYIAASTDVAPFAASFTDKTYGAATLVNALLEAASV